MPNGPADQRHAVVCGAALVHSTTIAMPSQESMSHDSHAAPVARMTQAMPAALRLGTSPGPLAAATQPGAEPSLASPQRTAPSTPLALEHLENVRRCASSHGDTPFAAVSSDMGAQPSKPAPGVLLSLASTHLDAPPASDSLLSPGPTYRELPQTDGSIPTMLPHGNACLAVVSHMTASSSSSGPSLAPATILLDTPAELGATPSTHLGASHLGASHADALPSSPLPSRDAPITTPTQPVVSSPPAPQLEASPPRFKSSPVDPSPMRSTWHSRSRKTWTGAQRMLSRVAPARASPPPPFRVACGAKVPVLRVRDQWRWVLPRAVLPLVVHAVAQTQLGVNLHPAAAFAFYAPAFILFSSSSVQAMTRMGAAYGYFDDTAARNNVPDTQSWRVLGGVAATLLVRPLLGACVVYRREAHALDLSLLLPLQVFVYSCVLDAWYYAYHRAMHEVPCLWRLHRRHHVAKHPTVLLSPFADGEQELMDILVMPLLAWLCFPVNFATWYVCQCFVVYTELAGHSGVRVHWAAPMTGAVLRRFGLELVVEDHDMHHRHGWRTSANYGKQTRIFDTLFGTTRPRVEGTDEHVDWARPVPML